VLYTVYPDITYDTINVEITEQSKHTEYLYEILNPWSIILSISQNSCRAPIIQLATN